MLSSARIRDSWPATLRTSARWPTWVSSGKLVRLGKLSNLPGDPTGSDPAAWYRAYEYRDGPEVTLDPRHKTGSVPGQVYTRVIAVRDTVV